MAARFGDSIPLDSQSEGDPMLKSSVVFSRPVAVTDKAGPIARKLAALPSVTLRQDGTDGVTVLFGVAHFAKVAKIMPPRRRRAGTKEVRAHLEVVGTGTRFKAGVGSRRGPRGWQ